MALLPSVPVYDDPGWNCPSRARFLSFVSNRVSQGSGFGHQQDKIAPAESFDDRTGSAWRGIKNHDLGRAPFFQSFICRIIGVANRFAYGQGSRAKSIPVSYARLLEVQLDRPLR